VAGSDITLWELGRRLDRMDADQRERFKALDDRIAASLLAYVARDGYEERYRGTDARLTDLERWVESGAAYRHNLTIAVVAAIVAAIGAVVASLVAVLVH
jgi:hypothetical protein